MSKYGEDGSTGYAKEELLDEMISFLENHTVSELLQIVADAVRSEES